MPIVKPQKVHNGVYKLLVYIENAYKTKNGVLKTFLSQLGDKGAMITMPQNGHMWTENEEQKEFLLSTITSFLLENVI